MARMKIVSPMPRGNGAYLSHRTLEAQLPGYTVVGYDPRWTYFPPALPLLCRQSADLVHTTPDHATFFARRRTPLVVTFRSYVLDAFVREYLSLTQRLHYSTDMALFIRRALARADCVTSISHYLARKVREEMSYSGDIAVIHNGIDTEWFRPGPSAPRPRLRVLFVGTMSRRKGAHFLPEIARRLTPGVEIHCTRGWKRREIIPRAPNILDIGTVEPQEMPALYGQADVLLFPTVREGFGRAALEAMACGLPVVASACSALPELVVHGKGGYLCPVGDAAAFAERINELADSPGLRRQMGQYNRQRAQEVFPLARMVSAYRALFERILDNAPCSGR